MANIENIQYQIDVSADETAQGVRLANAADGRRRELTAYAGSMLESLGQIDINMITDSAGAMVRTAAGAGKRFEQAGEALVEIGSDNPHARRAYAGIIEARRAAAGQDELFSMGSYATSLRTDAIEAAALLSQLTAKLQSILSYSGHMHDAAEHTIASGERVQEELSAYKQDVAGQGQ